MSPVKLSWPKPMSIELLPSVAGFREPMLAWGSTGATKLTEPSACRPEMAFDLASLDVNMPEQLLAFARRYGVLVDSRRCSDAEEAGEFEVTDMDAALRSELAKCGWRFSQALPSAVTAPFEQLEPGNLHARLYYHSVWRLQSLALNVRSFLRLATQLNNGQLARWSAFEHDWEAVWAYIEAIPQGEVFRRPPSSRAGLQRLDETARTRWAELSTDERRELYLKELQADTEAPAGLTGDAHGIVRSQQTLLALGVDGWLRSLQLEEQLTRHVAWDDEAQRIMLHYRAGSALPIICLSTVLALGLAPGGEICSNCGNPFLPERRTRHGLEPLCPECRGPVRNRERVRRHRRLRRLKGNSDGAAS